MRKKSDPIKLHSSQPLTPDEFSWLCTFRGLNTDERVFFGEVLADMAKENKVEQARLAPADRKPIAGKNVFALHRGGSYEDDESQRLAR